MCAPVLLVPRGVLGAFSRATSAECFLHELGPRPSARTSRISWVMAAVGVVHWFNPVIAWSLRRAGLTARQRATSSCCP